MLRRLLSLIHQIAFVRLISGLCSFILLLISGEYFEMAEPARKKPRNLFYTSVHERNINSVKLLIDTVLPVRYSEDFYRELIRTPTDFTKMAYYDDIFVGTIGGRVEQVEGSYAKRLYISVLAVLAPYRDRGIGSALLEQVMEAIPKHPDIKEVYLHVWTANDGAQRFYSRFGFEVDPVVVPNYYRGIDPPHAVIVKKSVNGGIASAAAPSAR